MIQATELLLLGSISLAAIVNSGCMKVDTASAITPEQTAKKAELTDSLVLAGGCFWCHEPKFEQIRGVVDVEVGYAGGNVENPTYEIVMSGTTGHAEAFKVTFDPKVVSAEDLLRVFFAIHDPTTKDRQGPDVGPMYRSAVFYRNETEKSRAEKIIREIASQKIWKDPIVTTVEPLKNYTRAEEYHQDYFAKFEKASPMERTKMNWRYCSVIIAPKVVEFRKKFRHLLKE